jgi:hypothetical protein
MDGELYPAGHAALAGAGVHLAVRLLEAQAETRAALEQLGYGRAAAELAVENAMLTAQHRAATTYESFEEATRASMTLLLERAAALK